MSVFRIGSSIIRIGGGSTPLRRSGKNMLGFSYLDTSNNSLYNFPTGALVTGQGNWGDASFIAAAAAGCEIYGYIDPMEVPNSSADPLVNQIYMGSIATAFSNLWPFTTNGYNGFNTAGSNFVNFPGDTMLDVTVSSAWANYLVGLVPTLLSTYPHLKGFFLDVAGDKLYSTGATGANFGLYPSGGTIGSITYAAGDWTNTALTNWTLGMVDLVQRIATAARAINPRFVIVTNNFWNGLSSSLSPGLAAEPYINGVCSEHHAALSGAAATTVAKTYNAAANARGDRRCFVIASDQQDFQDWLTKPGVTHVSNAARDLIPTGSLYGKATVPIIPFIDLR